MEIKIEKYFGRYRAYVKVEDSFEPYCVNFNDDNYYELSKLEEIRCVLEGDFERLIDTIYNRGFTTVTFETSERCKIFIDKPNKTKSEDSIKNEYRMKIIKKGE